jgi:hypothetical protein
MNHLDHRGCAISGATPAALQAYERALAALLGWRRGADVQLDLALQEAPGFLMAHVLQAYLQLCSRDPHRVRSTRAVHQRTSGLPANEREAAHLAVIAAVLDDDYEHARAGLAALLDAHPRDVLALHVAHSLDYTTGNAARMSDRVAAVLPAWSVDLPGYHAVLSMHAFGLVETGEVDRAEQAARAALALQPFDARAHHVMAHVFETTDRAAAGVRWMNEHIDRWATDTIVATHCWWHLALFHLAQGHVDHALALYDRQIRSARSGEIADQIDAAALLWRIELRGVDTGPRWAELADAWAPRIDDAYCSFSDLHAMLAFVGARHWNRAQRLEATLAARQGLPTRHGQTTRHLGLPACRALLAFGQGHYALATSLLAGVPALAHRLGGSHAQRDVLHLTLLQAVERLRRPQRRSSAAPLAAAAQAGRQLGQMLTRTVVPAATRGAS